MEINLFPKVAIVTGGGSGIGRAACIALAKAGAKVCAADIDLDRAEKTVGEIKAGGGSAMAIKVNVSLGLDVQNMIKKTVENFGRLDILYNNAGISPDGSVTEIEEADWDKCIAIDLRSVFLGAKYAIPELKKVGGGVILNTAGTLGIRPCMNKAAYSASKAAVINLTKSIALDYAKNNIRCNAICPGFVDTPLNVGVEQAVLDEFLHDYQPLPGVTKPEDIAALVVFLASDYAKMITGHEHVIDAGQQAGLY